MLGLNLLEKAGGLQLSKQGKIQGAHRCKKLDEQALLRQVLEPDWNLK